LQAWQGWVESKNDLHHEIIFQNDFIHGSKAIYAWIKYFKAKYRWSSWWVERGILDVFVIKVIPCWEPWIIKPLRVRGVENTGENRQS
jgi:hypothetical protein